MLYNKVDAYMVRIATLYHFIGRLSGLFTVTAITILLYGCVSTSTENLTIYAASSLTDALSEVGSAYEQAHPEVHIQWQFAGSSTLAAQLLNGAPADVFASADAAQMQRVQAADLVEPGQMSVFAVNQLALIVRKGITPPITSPADLTRPGIRLVLGAPGVPIRSYTDELLNALSTDYDPIFLTSVNENVVSEESNVRLVANRIGLGAADAAFVYRTDITDAIADDVEVVPLPDELNPLVVYPIAALANAPSPTRAADFIDYIHSEVGQVILKKWGFCVPTSTASDTLSITSESVVCD